MSWTKLHLLTAALSLSAVGRELEAQPRDVLHLKTVSMLDRYGWDKPIVAKTLLIPSDWRSRGGVTWKVGERFTGSRYDPVEESFTATSPDGDYRFEILPHRYWQWAEHQISQQTIMLSGTELARPLDAEGAVREYVIPKYRRGARVRDIQASRGTAKASYDQLMKLYSPLLRWQGSTLATEAIIARLEYVEDGRAYEEFVSLMLVRTILPTPLGPVYTFRAMDICTFRAPRGRLSDAESLFSTMMASIRINPTWFLAVNRLVIAICTDDSRAAGDRSRIWTEAMNEVGRVRMAGWQFRRDSADRVTRAVSLSLRGVDEYDDPVVGHRVELPTGWPTAWSDGQGGYILSADPSFDPNGATATETWQRIRRLRE